MYRVQLTDAQREELHRRARDPKIKPRTRDRLEMVRLSDSGFSVPWIAGHLGHNAQTVRQWIKAFLAGGFESLPDQPHPGQHSALTAAMEEAIRTHLRQEPKTWTAAQLAAWVAAQFGVVLSAAQLGRRLKRAGIVYKRTSRSVKHKQNQAHVAQKQTELDQDEKRGISERSTWPTSTKPVSP